VTAFCVGLLGLTAYQISEVRQSRVRYAQLEDRYDRLHWQPEDAQGDTCEYRYNENGVLEAIYMSAYEDIWINMRLVILSRPDLDAGVTMDTKLSFDGEGFAFDGITIQDFPSAPAPPPSLWHMEYEEEE
jgi:hypothetical protein